MGGGGGTYSQSRSQSHSQPSSQGLSQGLGQSQSLSQSASAAAVALERLRVLVRREFDPPLTTAELEEALAATRYQERVAYSWLKGKRWRADLDRRRAAEAAQVSMSQPVTSGAAVAKRRLGLVDADAEASKKRKSEEVALAQAHSNQQSQEMQDGENAEAAPVQDTQLARKTLMQTVESRAKGEHASNPAWADEIWAALNVASSLEIVMQLNLAADALAVWSKKETDPDAIQSQREAADSIIAVAALLPAREAESNREQPIAEVFAEYESEIVSLRVDSVDQKKPMYARAMAAEKLVQTISAVCQQQFDRLEELRSDAGDAVQDSTGCTALAEMEQAATRRLEETTVKVDEAELTLHAAKETMQSRAETLLGFMRKREKELVAAGESQEGAQWRAAVEIVYSDDDEIAAFRVARQESEERAAACEKIVDQRKSRQAFAQQALTLVQKIQRTRNRHNEEIHGRSQRMRLDIETCTADFVRHTLPTLIDGLRVYFDFRAVQEAEARRDMEEQERALDRAISIYGDLAPMKKGDHEARVIEFRNVRVKAVKSINAMVESQIELWFDRTVLQAEMLDLVVIAFKDLHKRSDGVIREALDKLVAAADATHTRLTVDVASENTESEDVAMTEPKATNPSPVEHFHDASDEPVVGTYRTAVSAVEASDNSVPEFPAPPPAGLSSPPAKAAPIVNENSAPVPVKLERTHEFALGDAVYTKFSVADDCNQFFHGKIMEFLSDGGYRVQYDDGDVYSVQRQFLFTEDQVAKEVPPEQSQSQASSPDGSSCAVM